VVNEFILLDIGLSINDIDNIDAVRANRLLTLHRAIKEKESLEMKKSKAKQKNRR